MLGDLPEQLLEEYPSLIPLTELNYESSTLYLKGKNYHEFLQDEFDPNYNHIIKYGDMGEWYRITRE